MFRLAVLRGLAVAVRVQEMSDLDYQAHSYASEVGALSSAVASKQEQYDALERDFQKKLLDSAQVVQRLRREVTSLEKRLGEAQAHEASARYGPVRGTTVLLCGCG